MKKHIPNIITCCNLISGCVATCFAYGGNARMALLWIVIGAVFDFFDGMVARLLNVSSPIGKELDSLADDVTFGVAPSMIIFSELAVMDYPYTLENMSLCGVTMRQLLPYSAFLMAAFSALRLAKFNLDTRQTTSFIGLPTPANALFWGSLVVGASRWIEQSSWMLPVMLFMLLVSCWLLVAEIPMFALKFKHWGWKGNEVKYGFLISCVPLLLFFRITAFAVIIAWYVVLSIMVSVLGGKTNNTSAVA